MIPINKPFCGDEELAEVEKVLRSGYLTQGPKVAEFEDAVKAVTGSKHAFAMTSATTALHLSLVALGIKDGDEVLCSDLTFPATGNVVIEERAVPVCVDVLPDTYAMDPKDAARKLSPRTKAILVVNPFGLSADLDPLLALAKDAGIPVIEDAACSLGAEYKGRPSGTLGRLGCYSFHPRKSVTTGEGGMIVTDDDALAKAIAVLRTHGGTRERFYLTFHEAGFNYRMSDINAAVGVAQMKKLPWLVSQKRALAAELLGMLRDVRGLTLPVEPEGLKHTYQSFVVVLDERYPRDEVIARLRDKGIETTLGTYAMHREPAYEKRFPSQKGSCPVSERLYRRTLTLPLWPQMEKSHLVEVVGGLDAVLRSFG